MAASISLPLVSWRNFINPNTTSLKCCYPDVYAGQKDGSIWVYTLIPGDPPTLQYKMLLVGHSTPVVALCIASTKTDTLSSAEQVLISASEDGSVARWQTSDGRCQAVNSSGFLGVPRRLKMFQKFSEKHIFCYGRSSEIYILDAITLEVVRVWGGHVNWVACTDIYDQGAHRTRLVTVTVDGHIELWDYDASRQILVKVRSQSPIARLQDAIDTAFDLVSDSSVPELCAVVTSCFTMIFALTNDQFVPQLTLAAPSDTRWLGGTICSGSHLVLWTEKGDCFDYYLRSPLGVKPGAMTVDQRQLYYSESLVRSYGFDSSSPSMTGSIFTAVCQHIGDSDALAIITVQNRQDMSTFTIQPLDRVSQPLPYSLDHVIFKSVRFVDVWPLESDHDPQLGNVTAAVMDSHNNIAVGYESGTICIMPVVVFLSQYKSDRHFLQLRKDTKLFEHAHDGPVTSLFVPEHRDHDHRYLLSGGRDGTVKIWSLVNEKHVASFSVHVLPVQLFLEPSDQTDLRIKGCVASIAMDNSLALISIESMTCLYIFPGYAYPLTKIQWRTLEDFVVIFYSDDTAHVWQLQTSHLDRIVKGRVSKDIANDDRWPLNHVPFKVKSEQSTRQILSMRSIVSNYSVAHQAFVFGHILTFHIRRLTMFKTANGTVDAGPSSTTSPPPLLESMLGSPENGQDTTDMDDDTQDDSGDDSSVPVQRKAKKLDKQVELARTVLSILVSRGVSEKFERTCEETLQCSRLTNQNLSLALKGAQEYFSVIAPQKDEKLLWTFSKSLSALRLLAITFISTALSHLSDKGTRFPALVSSYATSLPRMVGSHYCYPSLSLLSKYWQDAPARSLFSSVLSGRNKNDIISLIDYWEAFLPASPHTARDTSPSTMAKASIVLGIIGCDQPDMLNGKVRKSTALSLTLLLSAADFDGTKPTEAPATESANAQVRTLASMELLSQGFSIWEPYINASEVLRTLFQYSEDTSTKSTMIHRGARLAIFEIATTNMPLVIGTLTFDTIHSKSVDERIRCLKIIALFIRKKPLLLYGDVTRVVESVVKTLDPNVPVMRESVIQQATAMLHDLIQTYPFVAFSSSAQKLSVGTLEGAVVIYDLRTSTRTAVLEGHAGPITVVAFSPDAKFIATCSLLDQSVRIWYTNPSLFGMLTSSLVHGFQQQRHKENTSGTGASHTPYRTFSFALPNVSLDPSETLDKVKFQWMSPRSVKLMVTHLVMNFTI